MRGTATPMPICDCCKRPVERMEFSTDFDTDGVTFVVWCHGEKDRMTISNHEFERGTKLKQGRAFVQLESLP